MENKTETSTEKLAEFLSANGKDPKKLIPKEFQTAETQPAAADSSTEEKSGVDAPEKELTEIEADEVAGNDEPEAGKPTEDEIAEEKRLLEAEDSDLSPEDLENKKELLALKKADEETKRQKKIDKRMGKLTGELKDLRAERNQDRQKIAELEAELKRLSGSDDPKKIQEQVKAKEAERIAKYMEDDKDLPREERREMSREEIEQWMVEDMVGCQEWLADRQLRRQNERGSDVSPKIDKHAEEKAEAILRGHEEARKRVEVKHPELNISKRMAELKGQGKSKDEINTIIFAENPKVKIAAEIFRENPNKYMLAENGPELIAEEMEKRLAKGKRDPEDDDDREAEIARSAAEAERRRIAEIDAGISSTRGGGSKGGSNADFLKDPVHKQQVKVFMDVFKESEAKAIERLKKRLKSRGELRV